ncbi:putative 2-oxoglutarate-dependent dioxygenase AOP1 [Capsicum chacoense]
MASNTIPTIDFCNPNLKPGSEEWESTKAQVIQALEENGCFEAIYDKTPKETEKELFSKLKEEIYPMEEKVKEYVGKPFDKYVKEIPRARYNDFRRTMDLLLPGSIEIFANTFWPEDGNPHFCKMVNSYSSSIKELDAMVKRMIFEGLGLKDRYDEFMDENIFIMRFLNYKKEIPEGNDASEPRLMGHTDSGFLTIVKQGLPGLQVLVKNGEWIEPNVSPNSYIVSAADSMLGYTNGRLKSAFHRVKIAGDTDRFSIILFTSSKPGYIIDTPKELVDEEHPKLYKPYDVTDYYKFISKSAYETGNALKAFNESLN